MRAYLEVTSDNRTIFQNSGLLLGANTVALGLRLLQTLLLAAALGVDEYGALTLIITFTLVLFELLASRSWETVIKFMTKYLAQGDQAKVTGVVKLGYVVDAVAGAVVFSLIIISAELAAQILIGDPAAASLFRISALSVLFMVPLGTSSALLRVADRFDWLALQSAGLALLRLAAIGIALVLDEGILGVVAALVLTSALDGLSMLYLSMRVSRNVSVARLISAPLGVLRMDIRDLIRFALPTNVSGIFRLVQRRADILIIGFLLGPREVGFYKIARAIVDMLGFAVLPLYVTSYPEFARLWHQGQLRRLRKIALQMTAIASAISIAGFVAIVVLGELIIRITVGDDYLPSQSVMRWLALGAAIAGATVVGQPLLLAMGKATQALVAIGAAALVQVAILVVLLPELGIVGAGIAYSASYLVWSSVMVLSVKPLFRGEDYEPVLG